jgi:integrase/recombinase XerD
MDDRLDRWIAWGIVTHGWAPATRRSYRGTLTRFTRWLEANGGDIDTVEAFAVKAFLTVLPPTASSLNQAIKALRRWGEWQVESGARDRSPCEALTPQKAPTRVPRPYSVTEARRLMDDAVAEGGPVVAAISLQLLGGLRHSEMRTLRWADVGERLHVRGKGGAERRVPVPAALRQVLVAHRLACPPGDWVFPSPVDPTRPVSEATLRLWMAPVLRGQRAHRMRATYATEIGRIGGAYAVRDLLGHASIATSQHYVKFEEGVLDDCVQRLPYAQPDEGLNEITG